MQFSLGTLLTVVGILIGIFLALHLPLRGKVDAYKKEIEDLKKPGIGRGAISSRQWVVEIKTQEVRNIAERKYKSLDEGHTIDLSTQQISTVWSRMFAERNIIYLRATSLISPSLWKDPFMSKYEGYQRANIDYFKGLEEKERWKYNEMVNSIIAYPELRLPNFERIFIIRKDQLLSDVLVELIEIICSQSEYMDIGVAYEGDILPANKEDFGITISKEGDTLLYDLVPNITGGSLLGGHVKLSKSEREELVDKYRNIKANSEAIPPRAQFPDVAEILKGLVKEQKDLDEIDRAKEEWERERSVLHKCIGCFLESERTVEKNDWTTFIPARRRWYEMIDVENSKVRDYVVQNKPRRILEVGCGPGRLIKIIQNLGLENFDEIVGIEADTQMYNRAYERWRDIDKVKIFKMTVGYQLPYNDDDFDFCINAMNIVGWQENERAWLEEMLRCSKVVFFTLYKKGLEKERLEMYEKRKHRLSETDVHLDQNGQIILGDCAVIPNVVSRAYTPQEVNELCNKVSSKYAAQFDIDSTSNELLYICFIHKK